MANEMVERLMKALDAEFERQAQSYGSSPYVGDLNPADSTIVLDGTFDLAAIVRAAISAMREPTEAMNAIGTEALYDREKPEPLCAIVYTAMIDEALK